MNEENQDEPQISGMDDGVMILSEIRSRRQRWFGVRGEEFRFVHVLFWVPKVRKGRHIPGQEGQMEIGKGCRKGVGGRWPLCQFALTAQGRIRNSDSYKSTPSSPKYNPEKMEEFETNEGTNNKYHLCWLHLH